MQGFAIPFIGGNVITFALNLVRTVMKRKGITTTLFMLLWKHNLDLATFLGTYGGVFKVISTVINFSYILISNFISPLIRLI